MKTFLLLFSLLLLSAVPAYPEYQLKPGDDYKLIWSDDFSGASLNTGDWNYDTGFGDIPAQNKWGWGVGGLQDYRADEKHVFVSNGNLVIRAFYNDGGYDGKNYTSGKIHTRDKRSFRFGIIAARVKMPIGKGSFPAFWMVGTNNYYTNECWPQCGEIDIVEMFEGGLVANAASHWYDEVRKTPFGTSASTSHESRLADNKPWGEDYHIFELVWTPRNLKWKYDGKTVLLQSTAPDVTSELNGPMYLIFNFGIGAWTEKVGHPDASAVYPQEMLVDWVRVYQKKETAE
jgi:beta-glucanase (GH16 family)